MIKEFKCKCENIIVIPNLIGSFKCSKCKRGYYLHILSYRDKKVEFEYREIDLVDYCKCKEYAICGLLDKEKRLQCANCGKPIKKEKITYGELLFGKKEHEIQVERIKKED